MGDPVTPLVLAVLVPALSVLTAAAVRRWTAKRWPDPVVVAVADLDAKIERRCERIAVSQGRRKDAFKSWKADELNRGPR